jgi:hypothetical protein
MEPGVGCSQLDPPGPPKEGSGTSLTSFPVDTFSKEPNYVTKKWVFPSKI